MGPTDADSKRVDGFLLPELKQQAITTCFAIANAQIGVISQWHIIKELLDNGRAVEFLVFEMGIVTGMLYCPHGLLKYCSQTRKMINIQVKSRSNKTIKKRIFPFKPCNGFIFQTHFQNSCDRKLMNCASRWYKKMFMQIWEPLKILVVFLNKSCQQFRCLIKSCKARLEGKETLLGRTNYNPICNVFFKQILEKYQDVQESGQSMSGFDSFRQLT